MRGMGGLRGADAVGLWATGRRRQFDFRGSGAAVTVGDKQRLFAKLLPHLLEKAQELHPGAVAVGEVERSKAACEWNAAHGLGIVNSLHRLGLAVDLKLFRLVDGRWIYLTMTEDYRSLGEWWEALDELCCWGGRFSDGGHFSLTHEGVR